MMLEFGLEPMSWNRRYLRHRLHKSRFHLSTLKTKCFKSGTFHLSNRFRTSPFSSVVLIILVLTSTIGENVSKSKRFQTKIQNKVTANRNLLRVKWLQKLPVVNDLKSH